MTQLARPSATDVRRRRGVILAVLCVSLLVVSLDTTVLNVALPAILRGLSASSSELQWIVDAYAVVLAGLLLVAGSLGDRWGRKWVFVTGLIVFGAGSAASAFAGSPDQLIAARAFMGIGGAGIMPSTLSLLTNVFPGEAERQRAIGIWSGTTGLGIALGPIVGGWLLSHFWWGSVFLLNVPITIIGCLAALWLVPNSKNPSAPRPDPIGALLSIVGMSLLLWGIIEAPNRGWTSALVIGAIAGAVCTLGLFFVWERRCPHPMLNVALFRQRRFSVAIATMAMLIFTLMGALFLLTQYLQFSLGYTALQTGIRIMPIAAVLLVSAPSSTWLVRRTNTKVVVFAGMACTAVGFLLLAWTSVHSTYLDTLPALLLLGIGTGLAFAPSTDAVMGSLAPLETGVGAATNAAALQTGGALGVGVLGSLLNTRYAGGLRSSLGHYRIPTSVLHVITGSLGGALAVAQHVGGTLGAELAFVSRQSFVNGMDLSVTVGAAIAGVSALAVLALLPARPGPPGRAPAEPGGHEATDVLSKRPEPAVPRSPQSSVVSCDTTLARGPSWLDNWRATLGPRPRQGCARRHAVGGDIGVVRADGRTAKSQTYRIGGTR